MGLLSVDQLVFELKLLLGSRNDPIVNDAARLERWINKAYTYICYPSVHAFREMQSIEHIPLVTGTNEYSIATLGSNRVAAIRWVTFVDATTYSNTATRRKVHPRSIRQFEQKTLTTGPPTERAIDGEVLFISPVPTSNESGKILRVGYTQEPDVITGTEVTVLTSYFDRAVLKFAQAFAEMDLGERVMGLLTLKEATAYMNNASSESELEAEDTGFQIEIVSQPVMI